MCGIMGVVGGVDDESFERAALRLRHRGPDGFGVYHDRDNVVHLAHCRLAVIDLSENGRQPMASENEAIWVTFNGEIYNFRELRLELEGLGHRFRSQADTEVIVHAYEQWGVECVRRLQGMFAFGLWDRPARRVFLARDRIGIKPLYYTETGGRFAFASETKALLALPFFCREIDQTALVHYLRSGYFSPGESVWAGVRQVLPGQTVTWDIPARRMTEATYWALSPVAEASGTEEELLERLDSLIGDSVRAQMVSDVPLGLFLSGGVDSSLLTSYAVAVSPKVKTFSVGFEGGRNELNLARQTAECLGATHSEEIISMDVFRQTREVLDYMDEPLANDSLFPAYWLARAARAKTTVALSGDGADELFGGYDWYAAVYGCRWRKRLAFAMHPLVEWLGLGASALGKRTDRLGFYHNLQTPGLLADEIKRLFPGIPRDAYGTSDLETLTAVSDRRSKKLHFWQQMDMRLFLPCSNLVYMDRASMANSLEVRVPFLDERIIECAFSLTWRMLVRNGLRKFPLRILLERRGLAHVARTPKSGFSCPVGVYHDIRQQLASIREGYLVKVGLVDLRALDRLFPSSSPDRINSFAVFVLWILEEWFARFVAGEAAHA